MLDLFQTIKACLAKSFQFSGRASPLEYLVAAGIFCLIGIPLNVLYLSTGENGDLLAPEPLNTLMRLCIIVALLFPFVALNFAGVRREHDLAEKWQEVRKVPFSGFVSFFPQTWRSTIGAATMGMFLPGLTVWLGMSVSKEISPGFFVFMITSFAFVAGGITYVFGRYRLPTYDFANAYGPPPSEVTP